MRLFREARRRLRYAVAPTLCISLMAYAAYHFVEGERGLKAWWSLNQRIETSERELAAVRTIHGQLQDRVLLLREDTLDRDMLEERVRLMLNRGKPGEIVILYDRPLSADD